MLYTIQNDHLLIKFDSKGAELRFVTDKKSGHEYMWSGDSKYWGRVSPVLFPLVGNYRDHESIYENKTYTLGQHGFARDMEFECIKASETEIRFSLHDTPETQNVYPFPFLFEIGYELTDRTLRVNWVIKNLTEDTIYFSVGAHPAFVCDLESDSLRFETSDTSLTIEYLDGPCLGDVTKEIPLENQLMKMTPELFDDDALIIENETITAIELMRADNTNNVRVDFHTPAVGIWSPAGLHAPFVCIEPWYGRSDRINFDKKLENRELGNTLQKGEIFDRSYTITFFK